MGKTISTIGLIAAAAAAPNPALAGPGDPVPPWCQEGYDQSRKIGIESEGKTVEQGLYKALETATETFHIKCDAILFEAYPTNLDPEPTPIPPTGAWMLTSLDLGECGTEESGLPITLCTSTVGEFNEDGKFVGAFKATILCIQEGTPKVLERKIRKTGATDSLDITDVVVGPSPNCIDNSTPTTDQRHAA